MVKTEVRSFIQEWTKDCQKQLKNPSWFPWHFEALHGGILCTGAECPLITRGKNKGQPNFRKKKCDTIERVFVRS